MFSWQFMEVKLGIGKEDTNSLINFRFIDSLKNTCYNKTEFKLMNLTSIYNVCTFIEQYLLKNSTINRNIYLNFGNSTSFPNKDVNKEFVPIM